jgi:transposase
MAYPDAIRERVLAFYDEGLRTKQIATNLRISPAYCRRVKQHRGRPRPKNGGGRPKLNQAACQRLCAFVQNTPDATLAELQQRILDELQIRLSSGALWNTLRRLKLTLKKSRSSPPSRTGRTSSQRGRRSSRINSRTCG